jgi:hypothetical protein
MTTRPAFLLAILSLSIPATAQEVDRNVARLEWGALNILVIRDSVNGVGLWAAWTAEGERRGMKNDDEFVAHYDPQSVLTWLDEVRLILAPENASANDPGQIQSPPLTDVLGGRLFAVRLRDGRKWSNRLVFSMSYHPREKPLQFAVDRRNATQLLDVIAEGARASRLVTTPIPGEVQHYSNPANPSTSPEGAGVRGVVYPQNLIDQKIEGDVWFSFVVDTTGLVRVDESLRVLLSDHPLLTQTARESIRDSKYRPARDAGRPVPIRIYQRVMYRIRQF